jgi:hypothetical protein
VRQPVTKLREATRQQRAQRRPGVRSALRTARTPEQNNQRGFDPSLAPLRLKGYEHKGRLGK